MSALPEFQTERLHLRPRTLDDLDAIVTMNADPQVMRFISAPGAPAMGREAVAARSFAHLDRGLGYWSVFTRDDPSDFTGYVGLILHGPAQDRIELSYRFQARDWGKGYAFEAACRVVRHGFAGLGLSEILLTTHPQNDASLRLALRLGFVREADRPGATIGDPPVASACFRQTVETWRKQGQAASDLNAR